MTTPNPKSPVLTATEADAALAAAQRLEGNVTVGEALKHWGTIPQEDRDRLLETCREHAKEMFDWDQLLQDAVRETLRKDSPQARQRAGHIPGMIHGGGRRLAIVRRPGNRDTYEPYSPRNDHEFAEGSLKDWAELARKIVDHDERNQRLRDEEKDGQGNREPDAP